MDAADPGHRPPQTDRENAARDFHSLRASGEKPGVGLAIGGAIAAARDALARLLVRCGVTPNSLTWAGALLTAAAGYCLARGAGEQVPYWYSGSGPVGWWPAAAFVFLILAAACDMLDGAVARVGRRQTKFGGILDSVLDRFSDMAIYLGCLVYFAWRDNVTYQLLAAVALCHTFCISYVKARAEEVVPDCSVGFWLRGERMVAILCGCLSGHIPALLWQQALLPFLTVWRRMSYARAAVAALEAGRPPPPRGAATASYGRLQIWRHPRGTVPYDLTCLVNMGFVLVGPNLWPALLGTGAWADPLRRWLGAA